MRDRLVTDESVASDEALLRRVAQGDRKAFAGLVERHRERLMRLAYGIVRNRGEAEDVVQETCLRVWTRAGDWDPGRGARVAAWLSRIAVHLAIDSRRRPGRDAAELPQELPSPAPDVEACCGAGEIQRRIGQALDALPERQRAAFALVQFGGLGNIEAAASLGVGIGSLEQLLARARRRLRAELADLLEDA